MKPELDEPVKLKKLNRLRGKGGKFTKVRLKKRKILAGAEPKWKPAIASSNPSRMTMSDDDKVRAQFWRKGKKYV